MGFYGGLYGHHLAVGRLDELEPAFLCPFLGGVEPRPDVLASVTALSDAGMTSPECREMVKIDPLPAVL